MAGGCELLWRISACQALRLLSFAGVLLKGTYNRSHWITVDLCRAGLSYYASSHQRHWTIPCCIVVVRRDHRACAGAAIPGRGSLAARTASCGAARAGAALHRSAQARQQPHTPRRRCSPRVRTTHSTRLSQLHLAMSPQLDIRTETQLSSLHLSHGSNLERDVTDRREAG